jgi:hypothetical protein
LLAVILPLAYNIDTPEATKTMANLKVWAIWVSQQELWTMSVQAYNNNWWSANTYLICKAIRPKKPTTVLSSFISKGRVVQLSLKYIGWDDTFRVFQMYMRDSRTASKIGWGKLPLMKEGVLKWMDSTTVPQWARSIWTLFLVLAGMMELEHAKLKWPGACWGQVNSTPTSLIRFLWIVQC